MYRTYKHNKMQTTLSLIILSMILCVGCGKKNTDVAETESKPEIKEESVQVETERNEQLQEESAHVAETLQDMQLEEVPEDATVSNSEDSAVRNENLNGRGRSDVSRSEPNYINVIGYTAVSLHEESELKNTDDFQNLDYWQIPTYEKDKQFWNKTDITLPHKTEVLVKEQDLKHEGWGRYSGYLKVQSLEDGTEYYIDVINFVTKPYWTFDNDLRAAASEGNFIAEYKQVSDYYPVDSGGDKVEIPDGTIVLVHGVSGTTGRFDPSTNSIEAMVWKEWRLGYGGVDVYFNADDLTIIY